MEEKGVAVKLDKPGPYGGELVLIVDYSTKLASLVEIAPQRPSPEKIIVWEVQNFTKASK